MLYKPCGFSASDYCNILDIVVTILYIFWVVFHNVMIEFSVLMLMKGSWSRDWSHPLPPGSKVITFHSKGGIQPPPSKFFDLCKFNAPRWKKFSGKTIIGVQCCVFLWFSTFDYKNNNIIGVTKINCLEHRNNNVQNYTVRSLAVLPYIYIVCTSCFPTYCAYIFMCVLYFK